MAVPKSAMKRIGYFGEEGYMTLGDPYKTKVVGEAPPLDVAKSHSRDHRRPPTYVLPAVPRQAGLNRWRASFFPWAAGDPNPSLPLEIMLTFCTLLLAPARRDNATIQRGPVSDQPQVQEQV